MKLQSSSVRRSMVISIIERYVSIGLALASFVVVARLLTPTDIGLFSVASAIVGMAQVVRDFGVASYLVQEPQLTADRLRAAFTITALLALGLFIAVFSTAPLIAQFYADPRLTDVLRALSVNFLVVPVGSVSLALLRRQLAFGRIFWINLAANITGFVTVVGLAYMGMGALALVWSSVAGTLVTAGGACLLRPPGSPIGFGLRDWRRVLNFGSLITAASVVTEAAMNVSDLVIGRVMGITPVAIASRAQGVMNLMHRDLLGAVGNVMMSAFSKTRREGGDLGASFQHSVAMIAVIAWPFYGFVALFPRDVLRLVFGPQWDASAPLVPVFCLAGAVAVFWKMTPSLLQAVGRPDLGLKAELIISPARVVILSAAVLAFHSLEAFAWATVLVYFGAGWVLDYFRRNALGAADGMWTPELTRTLLVSAGTLALPALLAAARALGFVAHDSAVPFIAGIVCTIAAWAALVHFTKHPMGREALILLGRPPAMDNNEESRRPSE